MATITKSGSARDSAVLPAAGAYDTTALAIPFDNFTSIAFLIKYTRGAAGGAVTYKVECSIDNVNFYQVAFIESELLTAGSDLVNLTQRVEMKYQATGASAENFMSPTFYAPARWIRIKMKESGSVGSPGTASAEFYLSNPV